MHREPQTARAVSIARAGGACDYPQPPFLPGTAYPEMQGHARTSGANVVYGLLREAMRGLGMDAGNFGTRDWNPLGGLIRPGQKVLIKPNFVRHIHLGGGDYRAVVTHGSVVRAALDYAALALKGDGEITIGDAPVQSADFMKILELTGLAAVLDDFNARWGMTVRVEDFRLTTVQLDDRHLVVRGEKRAGDTRGYRSVNLGGRSLLAPIDAASEKFRVTSYDCSEMMMHHNRETHEYLIPKTVLDADVVINLPKLKTHRKVCVTAALKNLVGINGHKDWLPHHRAGSVAEGGDEYKDASFIKRLQGRLTEEIDRNPSSAANRMRQLGIRAAGVFNRCLENDPYLEGSWHGNDTLWRTVLDLNRILLYADKEGVITESVQRGCITVVDAVIAGEGEGPMEPDARGCGMLLAGMNPAAVDAVAATLMGFDLSKIPLVSNAFKVSDLPVAKFSPDEIEAVTSGPGLEGFSVGKPFGVFCFKPPSGWAGHVEFPQAGRERAGV